MNLMSKIVKKVKKAVKSEPVVCDECKGKGLKDSENLCPVCNGSGVINK